MSELKATILCDNNARNSLTPEWGLSVFIEYGGRKLLLDTGASDVFAKNADSLGIDLGGVEYGVLSHAHYDHSDGLDTFFTRNSGAKFYLRDGSAEDCYIKVLLYKRYIGIRPGTLEKYADRLVPVSGKYELFPGAYLLGHTTPQLDECGKRAHMARRINGAWVPDCFAHEQSLVLRTQKGLVIFNSCSHGGADNIIQEAAAAFPGERLYAYLGGLHLFQSSGKTVRALADRIKATGIERVITGHCTGDKACRILSEQLGSSLETMYTGYVLDI